MDEPRRYDSVEDLMKGEGISLEVRHVVKALIARDNGTDNPQTDSRIDLRAIKKVEAQKP